MAPFVLAVAAVCYMVHNYLDIPFFRQVLQKRGVPPGAALEIRAVLLQRSGGVVLLGMIPALIVFSAVPRPAAYWGLSLNHVIGSVAIGIAGGLSILVPMYLFMGRSSGLLSYYPEMRILRRGTWTLSLVLVNTASWAIYLAAYELLFRGLLLFPLVESISPWPAIAASSGYYLLAHARKHPIEASLVAPGGVMFAATAVVTGSLLGPWIAHTMVAAGSELLAARGWGVWGTARTTTSVAASGLR